MGIGGLYKLLYSLFYIFNLIKNRLTKKPQIKYLVVICTYTLTCINNNHVSPFLIIFFPLTLFPTHSSIMNFVHIVNFVCDRYF